MMRALLSLVIVLFATHAHAQLRDVLTIDMQPGFPTPQSPISLSVRSLSLDLSSAHIVWYVDGAQATEGEGLTNFNTSVQGLGTETKISVEATGPDEEFLTATRVVRPAEVDVLWESTSYAPPLYQGRHLAAPGSTIRVETFPRLVKADGTRVAVRDAVFTWRKNDVVITAVSGRGKSTAIIPGPELFGADTISVEVASVDNKIIAAGSVVIPSVSPFVALYQDHPLFGTLFHSAMSSQTDLPDSEATFVAVPYFADIESPDDSRLVYDWRVNGAHIESDKKEPSRITINAQDSNGNARIDLTITHLVDYLMEARGAWRLQLQSAGGGANLFGTPQ